MREQALQKLLGYKVWFWNWNCCGPRMFQKAMNRQENFRQQSLNPSVVRRVSFHIAEGKGESKA